MFSRQTFESPWPAETPLPAASSSTSLSPSRSRRSVAERHAKPAAIAERATIANQSQIGACLAPLHHSRRAFCFAVILTFVLHFAPCILSDQAKAECFDADFAIFSCWPTESASLFQNEGTQFVCEHTQPSSFASERPAHLLCRMQGTVDILISLSLTLSISL